MELEQELYELECSHIHPDIRISSQKLNEVLDEAFFEFGSSGKVWKRADYEGDHALEPDDMEISEFQVHALGPDGALTTYRLFNKTSSRHSLRSSIWRRRGNGWKLYFHQGTPAE
ncbi:nuclear transport factor 2 family protein [Planococcus lenghuensis]|uniref:DUF4440 domain-containing protein n=1 Tax=Planococcus lenghuensis TaxID=2213202 RepID=A0A1Q2KUR3_9BACL|nr:DUF4440 domain-containing protein [Planococcus lenghuensis]AQQ51864.1 DUF4440 domain-containing protein [Planococcus lenghuensis]